MSEEVEANDDELSVDGLVEALKKNKTDQKTVLGMPASLEKDKVEKFIIDTAAQLISKGMSSLDDIHARMATGSADEIAAFSELHRAVSTSVESLNRLIKTDKDNATKIKVAQLAVEAKKLELDGPRAGAGGLVLSREAAMKLLDDAMLGVQERKKQEAIEQANVVEMPNEEITENQ